LAHCPGDPCGLLVAGYRGGTSRLCNVLPSLANDGVRSVHHRTVLLGYVIYAIQLGSIDWGRYWRVVTLAREDYPIGYWLVTAFYFLYEVFLIVLGLHR